MAARGSSVAYSRVVPPDSQSTRVQPDVAHATLSAGWRGDAARLALIFALALALRHPIADIPLERDEGEYAYIAQRWLLGEVPYLTNFDQKPPGVFVAYAVIESCIGTSIAAIHWAAQVYTLGTLLLLYWLGKRWFSPTVALLAGLLGAFLTADRSVYANAANTEIFMILPMVGAMLAAQLAVDRHSLWLSLLSGVLGGLAILFKQVAVFDVAYCALFLAFASQRRLLSVAMLVIGVAAPLLPVVAYFKGTGAWTQFYDCVIGYNLHYSGSMPLGSYWTNFRLTFDGKILPTTWPCYALALVGILGGLWVAVRDRSRNALRPYVVLVGWLLCSACGVAAGGYFREHYFLQTVPMISLLAALGAATLGRLVPAAGSWTGLCITAAAIVVGVLAGSDYYLRGTPDHKCRLLYGPNPFPESIEVARFIADHSEPDDSVFIYGSEPQVYYYARRKCASRYIFVYPLLRAFPDTRARQLAVLEELRHSPPRFLIGVKVRFSLLEERGAPQDLAQGLITLQKESYDLVAVVPLPTQANLTQSQSPLRLLSGEALKQLRTPGVLLALWERRDQSATGPGT
jgi:hypothetical protein